jgi:hypothetical protein
MSKHLAHFATLRTEHMLYKILIYHQWVFRVLELYKISDFVADIKMLRHIIITDKTGVAKKIVHGN